ncbi:MAG: phosphonate ABC transporter, permease protein PhnE [Roseiflexaceae bacterium]
MAISPPDRSVFPARVLEHPLASGRPRIGLRGTLTTVFLLLVIAWAWNGTRVSIGELITSAPNMWDLITRMVPPDWSFFTNYDHVIEPTIVTIQLAITSTVIAVLLAFPISLLAARNISHPIVYQSIRGVLNIIRSIPELVWALIFVSAVGLGPFAGTLALVLGSVGSLSKIFAESIESINPKPVEAMDAVGASASQRIAFAVIPQSLVSMVSYALLTWEHNIRASFIVGAVGGGGLGFEITTGLNLFQYRQFTVHVIIIILLVTVADRFSAWIRARMA